MMTMYCCCDYHGKRKAYSMEVEEGIPRYKAFALMGTAILTPGHPGLTQLEYDGNRPYHMYSVQRGSVLSTIEKLYILPPVVTTLEESDSSLPNPPQFFKSWGSGWLCVYWHQWKKYVEFCEKRRKPMIFKDAFSKWKIDYQQPLRILP